MRLPLLRSVGGRPDPTAYVGSPQFRDGFFHNRVGTRQVEEMSRSELARDFARKGRSGRPTAPVPLVTPELPASAARCAATWLGHATALLEIGGRWVLTDPIWSNRCSPSRTVGPRRHHPVPMPLAGLPDLSAVIISHDHYDHLDTRTVQWLTRHRTMPFVVPLGIGSHLRAWGVPEQRIIELDWGESQQLDGLSLTCTEAQHFSGRLFTNNTTLWSSWALAAGDTRVFFGGDTGWMPAFAQIGEEHGPFDLTLLPIGAYDARWRDIHMDPDEAVRTHREVRGDVLLPIHWATFDLAFHAWAEPVERLLAAADDDVRLALPRPGERVDVDTSLPSARWWYDVR